MKRQAVHIIYGLFIAGLIFSMSRLSCLVSLSFLFLAGFFLSNVLRSGRTVFLISSFISACEREYHLLVRPGLGPLQFTLGSFVCLLLFGRDIAFISVLALTFGDSFSTLIGVYFGRHVLPWSGKKTFEGMFACFFASFFVGFFFLPFPLALFVAFMTSLLESFSTRFDDNIIIPFGVGVVLWLFW